ncbi:MAG: thioesterase family protein [Geothermobacteraceae bacterium]
MSATVTTELRVRYAETDAQGVVHHANYLVWFELGRSAWLRAHGLRYAEWERAGLFVVVAEATARYRAPAFYDDVVRLEVKLTRVRAGFFEFAYRVLDEQGTILADGHTRHLVVGADKKPARLPADLFQRLKRAAETA